MGRCPHTEFAARYGKLYSIQRAVKRGDPESHWPVEPYKTERKGSSYNYVVHSSSERDLLKCCGI